MTPKPPEIYNLQSLQEIIELKVFTIAALSIAVFCSAARSEVTRAGPAVKLCTELSGLTYEDALARQSVLWAEGYWTAFNIVLADNCMQQRNLIALQADRSQVWEQLKTFCAQFDHHDLQAAAYGVMMKQPAANAEPKPQCN